jgi:carboxynorspermidine decarboxylase
VAYRDQEIDQVLGMAHHITFNSLSQWRKYRERVLCHPRRVSPALRINPEYSEVATLLYNPCRAGTRFGVRSEQITEADLEGLEGLHFHTMCEQNSDTLARTLEHVEARFGKWLGRMKWLNMGGGHHITRDDYDVDLLCGCVQRVKEKYGIEVYMEPGEAVALNTGYLVARVVDVFSEDSPRQVILDTSASAHMPDVLEMPYRPHIIGAGDPGEKEFDHVLGGLTCLAGDDIGVYSFDRPLNEAEPLVFTDMAHYSMVKNTTFNGVPLPSIATYDPDADHFSVIRKFGYTDFRDRLS